MFQFLCRFAFFINFSSLKPDTKNNANFDAVSSKRANFDKAQFFFIKHIPKFIIFGTHNLQTFEHNTLNNTLLLMQLFLFNIRPKLHRRKWRTSCLTLFRTFSTSPSSLLMLLYVQPIENFYKLQRVVTFTFIQTFDQILSSLLNGTMLTGSVMRNFQY